MTLDEQDLKRGLKFIVGVWQVDYVVNAWSNDLAHIPAKEFKSKDDEFHRAFFEITHKMEIYQLQQKLQAHSDRVRNLSLSIVADEAIIEEHAGIVDCIRIGDAPLARSRLKLHLERYQIDAAAIRTAFPQYFKGKS